MEKKPIEEPEEFEFEKADISSQDMKLEDEENSAVNSRGLSRKLRNPYCCDAKVTHL